MLIAFHDFDPEAIARRETLFHTANGYVGVRACFEEGVPAGIASIRGAYINGFYDLKRMRYTEKLHGFPDEQESMVNAIDAQGIALEIEGEAFSLFEGTVLEFSQSLDLDEGVYERRALWRSPLGRTVELRVRRLCSLALRNLFAIEYAVRAVDFTGNVKIVSALDCEVYSYADADDPRMSATRERHLTVEKIACEGESALALCRTVSSRLQLACMVTHRVSGGLSMPFEADGPARAKAIVSLRLAPGESLTVQKYAVYADERRAADPEAEARARMAEALALPFDGWAERQQSALAAFWHMARVTVAGDPALEDSLNYNLYQLNQSAGRDALSNVAAKGLSGEGYEGHYFWDTEIYVFPFFLLTNPALARALLSFRHAILPGARAHARALGHEKGALYPWRTIAGRECSSYYPSGSAQYHLNGDVAHAFLQYYYATQDLPFMAEKGIEVLLETARLWLDVGHLRGDGYFCIDAVTGPDEYTCIVNNNFYTNCCARENLLGAAEIARTLKEAGYAVDTDEDELIFFERAGRAMLLPYDEKRGIFAQDEDFLNKTPIALKDIPQENFPLLLHYHPLWLFRHQVLKQADAVLAMCLYGEGMDEGDMRRTYDYYEPITTHDSSLSACVHAIMAARLGELKKAEDYFRRTASMDLSDAHHNTRDGIHTANMGGSYLCATMGFAGLRIGKDGLSLRPRLPEGIGGCRLRFFFRGRALELAMSRAGTALTRLSGEALSVLIDGKAVLI